MHDEATQGAKEGRPSENVDPPGWGTESGKPVAVCRKECNRTIHKVHWGDPSATRKQFLSFWSIIHAQPGRKFRGIVRS